MEAETNRALIAAARRVVVTADSSKWGVVGLSSIARLDEVDVLVTDDGLDADAARVVRSRVGQAGARHDGGGPGGPRRRVTDDCPPPAARRADHEEEP